MTIKTLENQDEGQQVISFGKTPSGTYTEFAVNADGQPIDVSFKTVIYTSGGITYLCEASVGAILSAAVWRVQKIDAAGNITHAGASASNCGKFDQVATDVATVVALSYF